MMKAIAYLSRLLQTPTTRAACLLFAIAAFRAAGPLSAQTVTVTSPVGGNTYPSCQPITISWTYSGLSSNVFAIEYSYDNFFSSYWAYPTNYTASGSPASVTWTPPNLSTTHYNASNLKVRVLALSPMVSGTSGAFTVSQNLAFTYPNGWETFPAGTTQTITFPNAGTSGTYGLAYSTDNGATYQTITSNYTTAGNSYNWTVPQLNSVQCRLKVWDTANPACTYDVTDTSFAIITSGLPIQGPQQVCASSPSATYTIGNMPGANVTWVPTNGTITGQGPGWVNVQWNSFPGTLICNEVIMGTLLSDTITVTQIPGFTLSFAPFTSPVCEPDSITLQITSSGGNPPFNYVWGGGISTTSTAILSGPGTYNASVTVTDANGCTGTLQTTAVINPSPTVNLGPDQTICPNASVVLDAGPGQSMYVWSQGASLQSIITSYPGLYSVAVYDAQGCTDSDTVLVTVHPTLTLLPADTILCADTTITLSVSPSFSSILWSNLSTAPSTTVNQGGSYFVDVIDANGCIQSDTIHITSLPDCVFPGDADYDGVANNNDVLAIGLAFGSSGGIRPGASTQWYGQAAPNWASTLPGGANHKHSDADGNGLVTAADTLPITLHYGRTHNKTGATAAGTPNLVLAAVQDSVAAGDTAVFSLSLGSAALLADSIFGIAFTVNYDTSVVDSQGILFSHFQDCWFAPPADRLSFTMDLYPEPRADMAVTRTSATDTSGYGEVCRFGVVTIDNISGKRSTLSRSLHVWLSDVRIITAGNQVLAANWVNDSTVVTDETSSLPPAHAPGATWSLAPNPAKGRVELRGSAPLERLRVMDLQGRVCIAQEGISTRVHALALGDLPAGVYMVEASPGGQKSMKKLVVID